MTRILGRCTSTRLRIFGFAHYKNIYAYDPDDILNTVPFPPWNPLTWVQWSNSNHVTTFSLYCESKHKFNEPSRLYHTHINVQFDVWLHRRHFAKLEFIKPWFYLFISCFMAFYEMRDRFRYFQIMSNLVAGKMRLICKPLFKIDLNFPRLYFHGLR